MAEDDPDTVRREFGEAVNTTASELGKWLGTDELQSVGERQGGSGESTGHAEGRRIVELLRRRATSTTTWRTCARCTATWPVTWPSSRPRRTSRRRKWRYSLMNWGHDPLRKG